MEQPLISYEQALSLLAERAEIRLKTGRLQKLDLPLSSCFGRVLAEDLSSPEAVPRFPNAQMDGFVVTAAATAKASPTNPVDLPIFGAWAAGDVPREVRGGGAYEITTGAMLPGPPYDAVVKVEDVQYAETSEGRAIRLTQPYAAGHFVRCEGEDFTVGQGLARAGQVVSSQLIMACAALGIAQVKVYEPIRIALLATGKELQRYSDGDLRQGAIRDASGPYLDAILQHPMFDLVVHKLVPDDPEMFESELNLCLELQPDIILSTGAVSMGRHDFVQRVIRKAGGQIHFHKVSVRPGKPILCAEWGESGSGPLLFGLPGNPISTLIGWRFFVSPFLRGILGRGPEPIRWARLSRTLEKPAGLSCFFKAKTIEDAAQIFVEVLPGQGSHLISPLLEADVWTALPRDASRLEAGSLVPIYRLNSQEVYSHD